MIGSVAYNYARARGLVMGRERESEERYSGAWVREGTRASEGVRERERGARLQEDCVGGKGPVGR
jgi:hypothetical protein